jgi:MEDS: MEthanogen/methylotroph, DcmR Sensory domain
LRPLAAIGADPRVAFLGGGPLDPDAMFAMFEELSTRARDEGHQGLRLVADMDWLLPVQPTTEAVIAFELLLDRHAKRIGPTIVCAYRQTSFDTEALAGALCVHSMGMGYDPPPHFRLVAGPSDTWRLIGEGDIAVGANFKTAITTAAGSGPYVLDASALEYIDVAGTRAIAQAGQSPDVAVRVVGAPPILRRGWEMAGFADDAPAVELVG